MRISGVNTCNDLPQHQMKSNIGTGEMACEFNKSMRIGHHDIDVLSWVFMEDLKLLELTR